MQNICTWQLANVYVVDLANIRTAADLVVIVNQISVIIARCFIFVGRK